MVYERKQTPEAIQRVLRIADASIDLNYAVVPNLTYEEGVSAALHWFFGDTDDNPFDEDEPEADLDYLASLVADFDSLVADGLDDDEDDDEEDREVDLT